MTIKDPNGASGPSNEGRRSFLKMAATAAPAAAVTTVAGSGVAAADTPEAKGSGLRETAHTRAYLASARF